MSGAWTPATRIGHLRRLRRAAPPNRRDDLGEPRPVALGHWPLVPEVERVGERCGECGVAMDRDAMAACEPEELRRARAPAGGDADRDGPADRIPRDRDGDVITE